MSLIIKKRIRTERIGILLKCASEWREEGVEVFKINEYQYRVIREGHAIDYYPTSGKYFDNLKNKWGYTTPLSLIDLFYAQKPYRK